MSCELDLGVEDVVDRIWKELRLIRVYTKRFVQPRSSTYYYEWGTANDATGKVRCPTSPRH